MALSPILVIGCGGSGGKVVLGLRRRLDEELRRRGWDRGIPDAWQLKWIDVPSAAEEHAEFGPPLPLGDYVPLATTDDYSMIDSALLNRAQANVDRLIGWRPTPNLNLPVTKGAGQMRAVGRAVALATTQKVTGMIDQAFGAMARGEAEFAQLAKQLGAEGGVDMRPTVFVVSSMAGGTGAGIFMDVCDLARGKRPEVDTRIFGFLFTAEIFSAVGTDGGMAPNTVASLSELINGYLSVNRKVEPLYGVIGPVGISGKSGPSWPFVLGMQPLGGGAPLQSPAQCYRALTETLLASMTNERFMQSFVNYQVTNFVPASGADKRLTAYQMLNQPQAEGNQTQPCGILSSFGSAIVSVGTAKFAEWARDRLARSVLDHVISGWEEYGRQLMGEKATAAVTQSQVVDFLVQRERVDFFSRCGLHEEDEPNGTQHNQVIDGILPIEKMKTLRDSLSGTILGELKRATENTASAWPQIISDVVVTRRASYYGEVAKALTEGSESFAAQVVGQLESAVSDALARYGVPVARGLVVELRNQCKGAIDQLRAENNRHINNLNQDIRPFMHGALSGLGNKKCRGDHAFVVNAVAQALGPQAWYALIKRNEVAIELLERVNERVILPLVAQLDDVGASLAADTAKKRRESWPDDSGGVSEAYCPSPTEKVLLRVDDWDKEYKRLMKTVAGSPLEARAQVAAGGFAFGEIVDQKTASPMVSMGSTNWWDRDGGFVEVAIALRPEEVELRARQWLWNQNHAAGKYVSMGLAEYLGETGEQRTKRLQRFEEALTDARQLAQPLVRISPLLMQRVHPDKDSLLLDIACEEFPFPPDMKEARAIVERVMHGVTAPEGGWFIGGNIAGIEKRLMTAVLQSPVQPATVISLTEPIAARWNAICAGDPLFLQDAIRGFWTYNRARPLMESIPLTRPSIQWIITGWFTGRLLGLITDPSSSRGFSIFHKENGYDISSNLPWPLLQHRNQPNLHLKSHQMQWLPALLEHVGLAMMLLGHDEGALDGYEQMYRLGRDSASVLEQWIIDGSLSVQSGTSPQLSGSDESERKSSTLRALSAIRDSYSSKLTESNIIGEWEHFLKIPFGFELFEMFIEALNELEARVNEIETGSIPG